MASYYGSWVATDDYRAVLDVTTGTGDGKTTYTIAGAVKVECLYGYASGGVSATLKVAGSTAGSASGQSMPTGTTKTLISSTSTTITRTHSSQSIAVSGTVSAANTPYYGASSTASTTVTVPAKASYAVSYNANGGSGAPSSQTKWHGETLALSSTEPTRSGYTFSGWNTASDGSGTSYAAGASYTGNATLALYAKWTAVTYAVSYNANGGSGAPSSQTKVHGTALTLSSTKPTKANTTAAGFTVTFNRNYSGSTNTSTTATNTTKYAFSKWNTASNGSGTSYASGASYTANAAATLYAQYTSTTTKGGVTLPTPTRSGYTFGGWYKESSCTNRVGAGGASYTPSANTTLYAKWTADYAAPSLSSLSAVRSDSSGTATPEGTYCKATLKWANGSSAPSKVVFKAMSGSTQVASSTVSGLSSDAIEATTTFGGGNLSAESRYTITATLTDASGKSYMRSTILTPSFFTLDFLAGGKGIGVGMAATRAGLDIGMGTYHVAQSVHLVSGNITSGTAPSSTAYGNAYLYFRDSAEAQLGFIDPMFYASGTQNIRFYASRKIDSTTYYNGFRIGLTASGDPAVGFHDTACRDAWLDALGIGAVGLKDSLAASDIPSLAASKINSGTLAVARGGTGAATAAANKVFAGPSSGDAAAPSFRGLVAADIPNHSTSKLTSGTLGIARGGTGSSAVTSVLSNTTRTVLAWGPLVMVQLHGATGTPSATATLNSNTLASYKPAYNVSAIVADTSGHLARLWVDAETGSIRLAAVNYTSSSSWYGTLVYLRVPS